MGFARSRRSLHDQIAPFGHVGDYGRLGRIGVQHVAQVLGAQMIVQALAFGDSGARVRETAAAENRVYDALARQAAVRAPLARVEVVIHEQLLEREEAERDRRLVHRPARHVVDGGGDFGEIGGGVRLVGVRVFGNVGNVDAEIRLDLLDERQVDADFAIVVLREEFGADVAARERDGDEYQRRPSRRVAGIGFVPLDHAKREKQRVDALLFNGSSGEIGGSKQPRFEIARGFAGLQPKGRARRPPASATGRLGFAIIIRLGQKRGFGARLYEGVEDVRRDCVHGVHPARSTRAVIQQRVSKREVEQIPARPLDPLCDDSRDFRHRLLRAPAGAIAAPSPSGACVIHVANG